MCGCGHSHCGRVMCAECSVFRYFPVSRTKHRVCTVCNETLAQANRLGDAASDAEASGTRSGVTDDGDRVSQTSQPTPSNQRSAGRKRGKLREGLKKTFASKDARKKRAERGTAETERVPHPTGGGGVAALAQSTDEEEARPSVDDLFDSEDDTWFADPRAIDASKSTRRSRDADKDDDNWTRSSVAQPTPHAAIDEWHTLASGSAVPKGPGGSVPIDVYRGAARSDDAFDRQRTRMEMPRPEQPPVPPVVATRLSLDESPRVVADKTPQVDNEHHPRERHTLKDGLKGMFHRHGKNKHRNNTVGTTPAVVVRTPTADDEVHTAPTPSHSTPALSSHVPTPTLARPTFYEANVDELVVDSSPGYFDYAHSREDVSASAVVARQSRPSVDNARWGEALRPASLEPRVVTSDQESYSIVESPTEVVATGAAPNTNDTATASTSVPEPGRRGFAGVLKRFLGISGAKSPGKPLDTPAGLGDASTGGNSIAAPVEKERQVSAPASSQPAHTVVRQESASMLRGGSFDRYSMAERSVTESSAAATRRRDDTRFTMSEYAPSAGGSTFQSLAPPSTTRASTFPDAFTSRDVSQKTRRDTFDELFESPSDRVGAASSQDPSAARAWSGVGATASAAIPTTGVDRFDRRRDDSFSYLDSEPAVLVPTVYGVRRSRSSSIGLGESSFVSTASGADSTRAAGTTWNTVSAVPSYTGATYAVPSSVAVDRFAVSRAGRDTDEFAVSSTHTSIMDDIGHQRMLTASTGHRTSAVDDIFAEFERPNDYVFDPVSGGYVSASVPPKPRRVETATTNRSTPLQRSETPPTRSTSEYHTARQSPHDRALPSNDAEHDDELDDTIVNKISSLEDELAALKQLIRQRKDHDNPVSTSRASHSVARHDSASRVAQPVASQQSSRKMSIFDHDSSSDNDAAARRQPGTKRSGFKRQGTLTGNDSRRTPKKTTQRRRDSFADLFDDSPTAAGGGKLDGGKGYESLFHTDSGKDESGGDSDGASERKPVKDRRRSAAAPESDDDDTPSLKPRARKPETERSDDDEVEEEELTSLKHRSRNAARRKPHATTASSSVGLFSDSDEEETKPVARRAKESVKPAARAPTRPVKASRPAVDEIDALFDSSSEHDVTNFFDVASAAVVSEDAHGSDSDEKDAPPTVVATVSATTTRSSGDVAPLADESASGVAKATKRRSQPRVDAQTTTALVTRTTTTIAATIESDDHAVDSDEEFSSMLKTARSRSLQPTSVATIPLTIRSVAATEPALAKTEDSDNVVVAAVGDSEKVVFTPTKKRVKSVSFFDDAQRLSISDSSDSEGHAATPDTVGEPTNTSVVLDSVQVTTVVTELSSVDESLVLASVDLGLDSFALSDRIVSEPEPTPAASGVFDVEDDPDSTKAAVTTTSLEPATVPVVVSPVDVSATTRVVDMSMDDDMVSMFDRSNDVYSAHFGSTPVADNDSDNGSDNGDAAAFSFEVKPKRRTARAPVVTVEPLKPKKQQIAEDEDGGGVLLLGRYATSAAVSVSPLLPIAGDDDADTSLLTVGGAAPTGLLSESVASDADGDWRQLQEQEKERRKKLQLKQRQAQRDKLLQAKKQHNASAKQLTVSTPSASASSEKKKKPKKDRAVAAADGSAPSLSSSATPSGRKKASSSKKHKHKSHTKDDSNDTVDSTRTEL